ncbi:MAG TPA: hypothetical protein VF622_00465 [Segetibacter sp.]|jgi:hypothetical protein
MKANHDITPEQEPSKGKLKSNAPFIFSIPRPYEDGLVERDKDMYVKVQKLQQRYQDVRQQLLEYAQRHERRCQQTRNAIDTSFSLLNRYFQRKQKDNESFS